MKDSGIEWIGQIPEDWTLKKFKFLSNPRKENSKEGTEELLSVSEYSGVSLRKNNIEEDSFISRSESLIGYRIVKKNDLVVNIMLAWKKGLGVSQYEGITSPAYSVFSFNSYCYPKYFHHLFRTDLYTSEFLKNSTGIIMSRMRLYDQNFGNIYVHLPPLEEQKKIADYLDDKTEKIDSLIENIKKKIELLEEQRSALISNVVTGKIRVS